MVPTLAMLVHPFEPEGEGSIGVTHEADQHGDIHPLSEKPEDEFELFGIGFEIVQRRVDATGKDFGAGLTLETLNVVVPAAADQRVNGGVCDAVIVTAGVGTREPTRVPTVFLRPRRLLGLPIGTNVGLGMNRLKAQTRLSALPVERRLRFSALRSALLPRCPQSPEEAMQLAALTPKQNNQRQQIEQIGNVGHEQKTLRIETASSTSYPPAPSGQASIVNCLRGQYPLARSLVGTAAQLLALLSAHPLAIWITVHVTVSQPERNDLPDELVGEPARRLFRSSRA